MGTRTEVKDSYQVVFTINMPEDDVEKAKREGKSIENCAWEILKYAQMKPTITKIKGSFPHTILAPYITEPDQTRSPVYFENLPADKFIELLQEGYVDLSAGFGPYDTLDELISFLNDCPEFCVGGLFYKDESVIAAGVTCKVIISDTKMIRFLKFARRADKLDTDNGNLRVWYD